MLRSVKLSFAMLMFAMLVGACQSAQAQTTYVIGPLSATGLGVTIPDAQVQANLRMMDMILAIEAGLPANEHIIDVQILTQGLITSSMYNIQFTVTVEVGPPMWFDELQEFAEEWGL